MRITDAGYVKFFSLLGGLAMYNEFNNDFLQNVSS